MASPALSSKQSASAKRCVGCVLYVRICMCVYICLCIVDYTSTCCPYIYTHTHTHTHAHAHTHTHTQGGSDAWAALKPHVFFISEHACVCVCIHVTHTHTSEHACVCVYTHHTHAHTQSSDAWTALRPDCVIVLDRPDELVKEFALGRMTDSATGQTYHPVYAPAPPEV
jgi:hypothetical protein